MESENIKNFLTMSLREKHKGFSGITHFLIAIFLFFCMWLIPIPFSQDYIAAIKDNIIFAIIIFLIISGASLLPDLDSSPLQEGGSTAVYQLGILGMGLSTLAITISGVVYSLFHTKYDEKPKSQHRMLFHSALIPIALFLYSYFIIEDSNKILKNNLNFNNISIAIMVAFSAISIYLGASMFLYKILSLIGKQKFTQILCLIIMVLSIFYIINIPYKTLKLIGIAISLGYFFHILADMFSKGSSPILFPIPLPVSFKNLIFKRELKFQLWKKPNILGKFMITTGGIVNIILNFVMFGLDVLLFWFIFLSR